MRRIVTRAQPGGEHQLAALEQVGRVGHLDHVRPAQLAGEGILAGDDLRQRAPHDGQLQNSARVSMTIRQP